MYEVNELKLTIPLYYSQSVAKSVFRSVQKLRGLVEYAFPGSTEVENRVFDALANAFLHVRLVLS
jgi:hypothetical protein